MRDHDHDPIRLMIVSKEVRAKVAGTANGGKIVELLRKRLRMAVRIYTENILLRASYCPGPPRLTNRFRFPMAAGSAR